MRLFEAILIVLAGQLALAAAVMGEHHPKWANLLPLVLLAPLAAHLALEGARWQMAPAYLVALGYCVAGTVRHVRPPRVTPRTAPRVMGIAGFVLVMSSAAAVALFR